MQTSGVMVVAVQRANSFGLSAAWVPLVLVTMNVVCALSAYPAGVAADRMSRRTLLALGLGALIAADLVLAAALTPLVVFGGVALWGLHMGLSRGYKPLGLPRPRRRPTYAVPPSVCSIS